jgi:hypothetical protein
MKVVIREVPQEIDLTVRDRVTKDVTNALKAVTTVGGKFIVNDTQWFVLMQKKLKARVMNTAEYISKTFENYLVSNCGWKQQENLEDQCIDAYLELDHPAGYQTSKTVLFGMLDQFTNQHPNEAPDTAAVRLYQMYVARQCFGIQSIPKSYHRHFTMATNPTKLRIGLEFETGNIASSFRSLNKLGFLYRRGKIDAGVFISSIDKQTAATRIWPAANRNGSFEELEARGYKDTVFFPIWEVGFSPDSFDRTAPYLGSKQTTYTLRATGKTVVHGSHTYEVWKKGRMTLLRRI